MGFPLSIRIALIPLLPNVDECKQTEDPRLDDDCRQLSTEAKAIEVGQRESVTPVLSPRSTRAEPRCKFLSRSENV
jgi:hypothetical protein